MALFGSAAVVLSFDVEPDAVDEHDDWHTHEHLPERLSIPGFLRGTRWVAPEGSPRYFVLYEVADVATLTSAPYLARLNQPTPWTAAMMPRYRAMKRGLCAVTGSFGAGMGQAALLVRFTPAEDRSARLREWLWMELPRMTALRGLGSAHLFEAVAAPPGTNEQRLRGADATIDWAVLVTGYEHERVASVAGDALSEAQLTRHGATAREARTYRMGYSLTHRELSASDPGTASATAPTSNASTDQSK